MRNFITCVLIVLSFLGSWLYLTQTEYEPSETTETLLDSYLSSEDDFSNRDEVQYPTYIKGESIIVTMDEDYEQITITSVYDDNSTVLTYQYKEALFRNSFEMGYMSYLGIRGNYRYYQESVWDMDNSIVVDMSLDDFMEQLEKLTARDIKYIVEESR